MRPTIGSSNAQSAAAQPTAPTFTSRREHFNLNVWMTHLQKSITTTEGSLLLAGSESWDTSGDSSLLGRPAVKKRPPAESVILPTDEAIPIGLIAKLSLSDTEKTEAQKVKEEKEEAEVSRDRLMASCRRNTSCRDGGTLDTSEKVILARMP